MTNMLLTAALEYRRRGWSINPLVPKGKEPLLTQKNWNATWKNYQNSLPSETEIKQWWKRWPSANVMVITGARSGLVVLDIDGPEGRETISELESLYGSLPSTPTATTGKGTHYYFQHPGFEVRNFARKLPGIDLRGDGGYVVAPPSIHPSGGAYKWQTGPENPLADVPKWLIKLIQEPKENHGDIEAKVNPLEVLAGVPEGGRNDALFKYACRLRAQGLKRAEAEILVFQAGRNCTPALQDKEIETLIDSAWKYNPGEDKPLPPEFELKDIAGRPLGEIFHPETIGALAILKQENSIEYAKIKATLKGKVNLNDLEREVSRAVREGRILHVVKGLESPVKVEDILPNVPIKGLIKPDGWNFNNNGVWQQTKLGEVYACSAPVLLTKRLRNIETNEEKVEIAFFRDGQWRKIIADRATVFNRTSLVMLTNKGLPVSSENAKYLVKYLSEMEQVNMDTLPLVKSVSHMGWACLSTFLPGASGDVVLDSVDGTGGIAAGYEETGNLEGWLGVIRPARGYPLVRLLLSASFAAPLLKLVGQRVFIVHLWGPSRGGKTAALKAALSVWGDPDEIIASFNATKVGLERLASFYCDLPLGIDERQVVGDKQGFVESLVYLLGLGKGKARGSKGGGLQAFTSWRTVAITTGEEPLSSSSSTAGIRTRALEIYGIPFENNEKLAAAIHTGVVNHSGVAGPVFIQRILEETTKDPEIFQRDYKAVQEALSEKYKENISSHLTALAMICTADYYASKWIFGLDDDIAFEEAMALAENVAGLLEMAADNDDGIRAYDYLIGWYGSNSDYFGQESSGKQRFGFLSAGYLNIFPPIFERTMKEGGYNSARVLRDWAEADYIKVEKRSGEKSKRLKVRLQDPVTKQMTYFVSIKLPNLRERVDSKPPLVDSGH